MATLRAAAAVGHDNAPGLIPRGGTRREALPAARDSGEARGTGRIVLAQEEAEAWAVLFFVPVYDGLPANTEERRASILGVVSGVFRIHDLLMTAGAHMSADSAIGLRLLDRTPSMHVQRSRTGPDLPSCTTVRS